MRTKKLFIMAAGSMFMCKWAQLEPMVSPSSAIKNASPPLVRRLPAESLAEMVNEAAIPEQYWARNDNKGDDFDFFSNVEDLAEAIKINGENYHTSSG
jgi:hypothetical protein